MESGLEGRNNVGLLEWGLGSNQVVSMESGLEGQNNDDADEDTARDVCQSQWSPA